MNVHKLLEEIESKHPSIAYLCDDRVNPLDPRSIPTAQNYFGLIQQAQKFYLGDVSTFPKMTWEDFTPELCQPPATSTLFEYTRTDSRGVTARCFILLTAPSKELIDEELIKAGKAELIDQETYIFGAVCFFMMDTKGCPGAARVTCINMPGMLADEDGQLHMYAPKFSTSIQCLDDNPIIAPDDSYKNSIFNTLIGLHLLNCENIETHSNKPNKKRSKSRKKKGKLPLYSYKTLKIKHTKPANAKTGAAAFTTTNTHASPRFHFRRGHIRRYANGKHRFIRPTWVGDPEKGYIDKDYVVAPDFMKQETP